ncbi:MAG TPA: OsmC family protein [Burkholderiales bacterium]|nr:OsmC family protein [Burkholderiales bacterium]
MDKSMQIKQALDRMEGIFRAKPSAARFTKGGRATLIAGLLCEYTEEGKSVRADMPPPFGGEGKGLSPGGYARAGLSMCLAIGYAMRAAHRGLTLHKVEVDIEADADFACLFGLPAVPYSEFRYCVRIESDAPQAEVIAMVDEADARSPVLDAFREAKRVLRSLTVSRPETV